MLLVGDSTAGKSRAACEAVRRDPLFRERRLLVPLTDGGAARLVDSHLGDSPFVVWIDDIDKYFSRGLDEATLQRLLASNRTCVVVATIRTSQLEARRGELADPVWRYLTEDDEIVRVDVRAAFSDDERRRAGAVTDDRLVLNALADGVGPGEWLLGGREMMRRLRNERGPDGVYGLFADIVAAWYRTGIGIPLDDSGARSLWECELPAGVQQRLARLGPGKADEFFGNAREWACKPVVGRELYEQSIVTKLSAGYQIHDYVLDHIVRDPNRSQVPDSVWQLARARATERPDADDAISLLWQIGVTSFDDGAFQRSVAAWDDVVVRYGNDPTPAIRERVAKALVNKGFRLGQLDRSVDAIAVYDDVVVRYGNDPTPAIREQVANALFSLGCCFSIKGDLASARIRWDAAASYGTIWVLVGVAPIYALLDDMAKALDALNAAEAAGHESAKLYAMALSSDADADGLKVLSEEGDSDALNILGVVAHRNGDSAAATRLTRSDELDDGTAPALLAMAGRLL